MKKILTGALALMLFAGAAQAQSKQDTSFRHHKGGHEMMMKQLNLTANQQTQLKSIHENERKEMLALKSNTSSVTADQLKAQRKELHKKYHDQMQNILTPAQKDQLKKLKAEHKGEHGKKGQWKKDGKAVTKRGDFQKQLNLTPEQQDQLTKMRTDVKGQVQSIRNDQSLTQDQKKEKIHSLMKDQQEKFKSVLTQDQIEKLQSLRKEHQAKNTK
jgi:Spy/CpxP family protein refolding chaperone